MRILHTESSTELGGQEYRTLYEARGMMDRGHDVLLAVSPGSRLAEEGRKTGVRVELIKMVRSRWVLLIADFAALMRRFQPQIVNTHNSLDSWTASIACKVSRPRPKVVRTRHKSTPIANTRRHRLLYQTLPDAIVTTGELIRKTMIQDNGIDPARIVSIPTGVDLHTFRPRCSVLELRSQLGVPARSSIVGTIAFLRSYKGVDHFLQAARLVVHGQPDVWFLVVGEGPERGRLEFMISDLGLEEHVRFLGFREDIPELLSIFDVFVLSSTRGEGVPQALVQAMAMGKAVVATRVGGIPEVVQDGQTGLLCSADHPAELASAISRLLNDHALRARLGEAARELVVRSMSVEQMLNATESLYHVLLNGEHVVRGSSWQAVE